MPETDEATRRAACDEEVAKFRTMFADVQHIEPFELKSLQSAGPVTLIDVRSPDEYATSTLPGAMPLAELRLPPSDSVTPIVVFCTVGYRSALEARRIANMAPQATIYNMLGVLRWAHEGGSFVEPMSGRTTRRVHVFGSKWAAMAPSHIDTVIFSALSFRAAIAVLRVPFLVVQHLWHRLKVGVISFGLWLSARGLDGPWKVGAT